MAIRKYIITTLKGMGMGAADVVPGVSGGTIAFISGIYDELLDSINALSIPSIKVLFKDGIAAFWRRVNGKFLLSLFLGIAISIVSLAKGITWLLENEPIYVWSFFFGLIVASIFFVKNQVKRWNLASISTLIVGAALAYYITIVGAASGQDLSGGYILLCGALAICAMILPGISGSFILLLLGAYQSVLGSISGIMEAISMKNMDGVLANGKTIALFGLGCIVGLLSFSRILSWLLKKWYSATIALLTGFLIGSLNKVWPWKEVISTRVNSHGEEVPFMYSNILPTDFAEIGIAIVLSLLGYFLIYFLEKASVRHIAE